ILYNKNFIDMFSITLISQIMMSFAIMAMTFFGRWFAFPRTIIFINLIVSTLVLALWRFIIIEFYYKKSGVSRVMVVGPKNNCMDVVRNFKSSKTKQYKIVSITVDNYYQNIMDNLRSEERRVGKECRYRRWAYH